jgi:hypothetical protein
MIVHDTAFWGLSEARNPQGIHYEDWSMYWRARVIKAFGYVSPHGLARGAASGSGLCGWEDNPIHGITSAR